MLFVLHQKKVGDYFFPELHLKGKFSVGKHVGSRDSSDSIVTSYGLHGRGSIPGMGKMYFSFPQHPHQLWGHYVMDTVGSFPGRGVKLTSHLHLVPRSGMVELYLHSPICLDGAVLY
jgi:hypothetical protein